MLKIRMVVMHASSAFVSLGAESWKDDKAVSDLEIAEMKVVADELTRPSWRSMLLTAAARSVLDMSGRRMRLYGCRKSCSEVEHLY